jgi:NADH:ubiquinone reductase (H+-translocating)
MNKQPTVPHIIIVGGGAGGLELTARLARSLGKTGKTKITLVDAVATHLWKPLLHEVAAGTLNPHEDELSYFSYAKQNKFYFCLGTLQDIDRQRKEIILAPLLDADQQEYIPQRRLFYDILIIAVGSVANDFAIPGAREHCFFLDNREQADQFQRSLLKKLLQLAYQKNIALSLNIAIVGGGATGVELAAELHYVAQQIIGYGIDVDPKTIKFTLIESGERLVAALPQRISDDVSANLKNLGITVLTNERVTNVTANGLYTQNNRYIAADLMIWTAGIKAPVFLTTLDGLETNKANQLIVQPTLQTTLDKNIFAFGDCAYCKPSASDKPVPPRAQAAHQQAKFLAHALPRYLTNKSLPVYHYHDYGSLITLSHCQTVGNLMARTAKTLFIEGKLARFFYWSLYKEHQVTLHGLWQVVITTLGSLLSRKSKPRLKLH